MNTTYRKVSAWTSLVVGGMLLFSGCSSKGYITAAVQSVIGLDVSENPQTQVPHVRFGFARSQLYYIPTGKTENAQGSARDTPDLVSDIDVDITPLQTIRIKERFAVGAAAVQSPASQQLFAGPGARAPTVVSDPTLSLQRRGIRVLLQDLHKEQKAREWIKAQFPNDSNRDNPDKFLDNPPDPRFETLDNLLKHLQ